MDLSDEAIFENFSQVYSALSHALPNEEQNINSVYLKLTMSKAIKQGQKQEDIDKEEKEDKQEKADKKETRQKRAKKAEKIAVKVEEEK